MSKARRLSADEIREILDQRAQGAKLASIAHDHGLSEGAISRICARKAYGWVDAVPAQEETTHVGG